MANVRLSCLSAIYFHLHCIQSAVVHATLQPPYSLCTPPLPSQHPCIVTDTWTAPNTPLGDPTSPSNEYAAIVPIESQYRSCTLCVNEKLI